MNKSLIGLEKCAIPTPALLVDLDKMEQNIKKMAQFFQDKKANLRPHIKTHKTPAIAHKQIKAGAIGVTCQKLAEAEVMADVGIKDILISNEIVEPQKIKRLVNLSKHTDLKVAVDNSRNILNFASAAKDKGVTLGVLVEVNIGMNRCGVSPGEPALELAQKIHQQPYLEFLGLMGYEGHTVFIQSYEERKRKAEEALRLLIDTKRFLGENGLKCRIVSGGGTGTFSITGSYPGITEVQAGNYVTMDTKYASIEGVGEKFEQALTLLTTVISRPTPGRAVLDIGMKAVSTDTGPPELICPGRARVGHLSEEHTPVDILDDIAGEKLQVGTKIELAPAHGCTTFNLHDQVYGIRNNEVESIWEIKARGEFE